MSSSLMRYDPFEELSALQRRFFNDDMIMPDFNANMPATDVYEKDGRLFVEASLPNFSKKDIDISVDKDNLVIRAEHHEEESEKDKKYLIRESASSFYRSITLPERADKDNISADMVNGKLVVTIPMAEEKTDTRKIAIGDGKKED